MEIYQERCSENLNALIWPLYQCEGSCSQECPNNSLAKVRSRLWGLALTYVLECISMQQEKIVTLSCGKQLPLEMCSVKIINDGIYGFYNICCSNRNLCAILSMHICSQEVILSALCKMDE